MLGLGCVVVVRFAGGSGYGVVVLWRRAFLVVFWAASEGVDWWGIGGSAVECVLLRESVVADSGKVFPWPVLGVS